MTGRGIDQILAEPCAPHLYEPVAKDAREYVAMAEHTGGPIPRNVAPAYPWGVALEELERRRPAARIVNLETSVTTSEDAEPKGINYRMHPANIAVLRTNRRSTEAAGHTIRPPMPRRPARIHSYGNAGISRRPIDWIDPDRNTIPRNSTGTET